MSPALNRRGFLKGAAATGLGAAAQTLGPAAWQRSALAQTTCPVTTTGGPVWGNLPSAVSGSTGDWDCNFQGYKILEIYLQGGASPWETFWLSGAADPLNILNVDVLGKFQQHGMDALNPRLDDLSWLTNSADARCSGNGLPTSPYAYQFFANQNDSTPVNWGAPAKPLWSRPDIANRCRMVTMAAQTPGGVLLDPHEAAVPYCLTGLLLGNSRMAGISAAIEHRVREKDPGRNKPASYVLYTYAPLCLPALAATGDHPGLMRPVMIELRQTDDFRDSLSRTNVINTGGDDLFRALRHEYRDRLRFQGAGRPIRSAGFEGYWAAADQLQNASGLQQYFPAGGLTFNPLDVTICPTSQGSTVSVRPGAKDMIKMAAKLLLSSSNEADAKYVCVVDAGRAEDYDTHGDGIDDPNATFPHRNLNRHVLHTCANYYDTLKHLADNIYSSQYNPSGQLNLNDTMVVITTEFGRTNDIEPANGRGHHPAGYVTVFIGGPIPDSAPTIGGNIGSGGITDPEFQYSPTDVRGAMLLAAGIDPFAAPGNFREDDFSFALKRMVTAGVVDYTSDQNIMRENLKRRILGV